MKQGNVVFIGARRSGKTTAMAAHARINNALQSALPDGGEGAPIGPGEGSHAGRMTVEKWLQQSRPTLPEAEEPVPPLALRYRLAIELRLALIKCQWLRDDGRMALLRQRIRIELATMKAARWLHAHLPGPDAMDGVIGVFCCAGLLVVVLYQLFTKGFL